MSSMERLLYEVKFIGYVLPNKSFIIVDDMSLCNVHIITI
jgi:hypothetical protein